MEKSLKTCPVLVAWLVLCVVAGMLPACARQTTSNVAVGEIMEGEEGEILEKAYSIKDKVLSKKIEVLDVTSRYVGDFLEAQAILRNRKKTTTQFEYKFEWFDEDGFPIESNITLWKPDLLYGEETKWIRSTCPKPQAKGFKVMIREPNPVEEQ
jgi:uncharacterized protein YcfL